MLNIKKILFSTDFSDCSRQTLTHALLLAERNAAELHMLHAIVLHDSEGYDKDHDFASGEEIAARLATIADQELDGLAGTGQGRALAVKKITRRGIGAADVILEYADEEDVDLIVMGTQGRRHAARLLLGSVAEEVVRLSSAKSYLRIGASAP